MNRVSNLVLANMQGRLIRTSIEPELHPAIVEVAPQPDLDFTEEMKADPHIEVYNEGSFRNLPTTSKEVSS